MRQSNSYIVLYAAAITVVCGGLLAFASQGLKPFQDANIELERKSNILATVMELKEGDDVNKIYAERIKELVVDAEGNAKEMKATDVDVAKEYKKAPSARLLPLYEFRNTENPDKIDFVVMPMYGFGLWNDIWGFVALQSDLSTIQGVKFQHKGETPGLGARIESEDIQARYKGKSIFEAQELVSVRMMKGEGNDYSDDTHKVDGMSGATLTANGVNNMLTDYLNCYQKYLVKNRQNIASSL